MHHAADSGRKNKTPTACGLRGVTGSKVWAVTFVPTPLPNKVLQTTYCTHSLQDHVLQTLLGMGIGTNVTAQTTREQDTYSYNIV